MKQNFKTVILFPPGWSFCTGSPYLAPPLLSGFLQNHNIDITIKDINKEIANFYQSRVSSIEVDNAVENGIRGMNTLYFREENKLNDIAKQYDGSWNIQLGFTYNNYDVCKSNDVLSALNIPSPFDDYYDTILLPWIERECPDAIALSIAEKNQIIPTFQLINKIRSKGFQGKIIVGGSIISRLKEELKLNWVFDLADYLIIFQGETPLLKLINAIQLKSDINYVPSLMWRKENGKILENNILDKKDQDCNLIPTPDFEGLPLEDYWGINYLPLVHYRGCYFGKCPFCPIPYGWGNDGFAGNNTVENVFQDMNNLYIKYGITRFQFVDETFPAKSAIKLSKLIIENKKPFEWSVFARFETKWADEEVLNFISKGGLRKLHIGLEIIATENRKSLGKNDTAHLAEDVLINSIGTDVKIHFFCMFGFPGTDVFDAEATIDFILNNKHLIDSVDINPYAFYKHTKADNIKQILNPEQDWALEYDYEREEDKLNNKDIINLAESSEYILWQEKPTLLHPIYRLNSPWNLKYNKLKNTRLAFEYSNTY